MKKINVVAFLAKSGTGKSTIIEKMSEQHPVILTSVKSYSTREPRDEFDKLTHVFVEPEFYIKNQSKALLTYYNPEQNYFNWVDESSFDEDKINLYAIDVNAYNKLASLENFNVLGIYLDIDEKEREKRITNRGGEYTQEDWLDKSLIDPKHIENNKCIILDCSGTVERNVDLVEKAINPMVMSYLFDRYSEMFGGIVDGE